MPSPVISFVIISGCLAAEFGRLALSTSSSKIPDLRKTPKAQEGNEGSYCGRL
jgi:hypothetical protein